MEKRNLFKEFKYKLRAIWAAIRGQEIEFAVKQIEDWFKGEMFKWYNMVFEKESKEAVQAALDIEATALNAEKQTTQYIRSELYNFRQEVYSQLNMLMCRIDNCAEKDRIEFIKFRLEHIERSFFPFSNCKPVCEMLENHKSRWIPDSKGGEPNHRKEIR